MSWKTVITTGHGMPLSRLSVLELKSLQKSIIFNPAWPRAGPIGGAGFALPAAILASAYYEDIQKRNFLVSLEAITEINLFSNLPIGAITKINSKLEPLVLPAKQIIFEKGDIADALYIIEFGSVQVEIETPVVLGSGDYFGETGLISQAERNATISVLEEAKLLKLSKESLDELTEEYPALFEDLKQSAADRTG